MERLAGGGEREEDEGEKGGGGPRSMKGKGLASRGSRVEVELEVEVWGGGKSGDFSLRILRVGNNQFGSSRRKGTDCVGKGTATYELKTFSRALNESIESIEYLQSITSHHPRAAISSVQLHLRLSQQRNAH